MEKKLLQVLFAFLTATILLMGAANGSSDVTYVGHEKVEAALAKGGNLVTAKDLLVLGSHRTEAGHVEVHEKETDVFYVVDGDATLFAVRVAAPQHIGREGHLERDVQRLRHGTLRGRRLTPEEARCRHGVRR